MTFYFGFPFVLLYFAQSAASVYRTKSKNVNLSILSTCFFNVILKRNEKKTKTVPSWNILNFLNFQIAFIRFEYSQNSSLFPCFSLFTPF